jgi:hypothetical protein
MQIAQLPYLDEHATTIAASADDVWSALIDTLDRGFSGTGAAVYARAVGCVDHSASGPRPLAERSTIPGFHVTVAVAGAELALEGRHRFSTYALIFHLEQIEPDRSILRAESRADFPGISGGAYRLLVVGTRGHVVAVRHLLSTIKRRSEASHI